MEPDRTPVPMAEIEAALARVEQPDANCVTEANGDCVAPGPCMHTPPEVIGVDMAADEPEQIASPEGTKGWTHARKDGIETFTATDGTAYVRARPDEEADVIVSFSRIRGMTPMRLVRSDQSTTVRRAARKARREAAELRKRGYDV